MKNKKDHSSFSENPLKEGEDFYYNEEGLMVLTRKYHLRRGHCCKSDCTHCPFDLPQKLDPNTPQELQSSWSESDSDDEKYSIDPEWGID